MSENEELIRRILSDKTLLKKVKNIVKSETIEVKSNEELIDFWLYRKAYSDNVIKNYQNIINYFLVYLKNHIENRDWNLQEITIAEIDSYKTYLEKNKALGIQSKILYNAALKSFYEFYQKQSKRANLWNFKEFPYFYKLNTNPGEIDIINEEKKIAILNPEETKIYLKRIFRINKEFYLCERLQYESGLRFIDMARIKTEFLRLHQRRLYTQGRRGFRCYYISEELTDHLLEYSNTTQKNLLFHKNGKQLIVDSYRQKLKRIAKKIGIPKNLSTRSGRKSFTTNRFEYMKQPDDDISRLMGHQVKSLVDRYKVLGTDFYLKKFDDFNYLKTIF